jgi:hypothetical protein
MSHRTMIIAVCVMACTSLSGASALDYGGKAAKADHARLLQLAVKKSGNSATTLSCDICTRGCGSDNACLLRCYSSGQCQPSASGAAAARDKKPGIGTSPGTKAR